MAGKHNPASTRSVTEFGYTKQSIRPDRCTGIDQTRNKLSLHPLISHDLVSFLIYQSRKLKVDIDITFSWIHNRQSQVKPLCAHSLCRLPFDLQFEFCSSFFSTHWLHMILHVFNMILAFKEKLAQCAI